MPISRLFAETLVRSLPSTETVPEVASSRPARMRSAVVLPHPGRAEQGDQLTRLDVQRQPVEGLDRAVDPGEVVQLDGNAIRHVGTPGCVAVVGAATAGSAPAVSRRLPRVTSARMSSSTKPKTRVASDAATDVGPSLLPISTI